MNPLRLETHIGILRSGDLSDNPAHQASIDYHFRELIRADDRYALILPVFPNARSYSSQRPNGLHVRFRSLHPNCDGAGHTTTNIVRGFSTVANDSF